MTQTARAARAFGVDQVNGLIGSPIWHQWYFFPPTAEASIEAGFKAFVEAWHPIFDVLDEEGVRFGLEIHPTEIAYDSHTAERTLAAIDRRPAFGFNRDPSHLYWQFVDPARLIARFPDRLYHVHMTDALRLLDGETSILGSHLNFWAPGRGWGSAQSAAAAWISNR